MQEYFAVWEIYTEQFVLLEKGYHFFSIDTDQHLMVEMAKFCERRAEEKNINVRQVTFSSVQKV